VRTLDFFSQGLRQPVLVEREIGDQPFQPTVFFFQLSELAQFTHAQVRVLFPGVECGVTRSELLAEVANRCAAFCLSDRVHDLSSRER